MVTRSRSRDNRGQQINKRSHWIAVSPCVIMDNITLNQVSKRPISVVQKDQYYFPSNAGFDVKITKWTGQDHIGGVHISQQVVKVEEKRDLDIMVENPYDDRALKLEKLDKIACLSVFSVPIPRFSNSMSPERYETHNERWFKVTTALLHKKGHIDSISIAPNKTMRIIATIVGPIKRFVDMEVLVSEIDSFQCPIDPQICRIMENDCIGFLVSNRSREPLIVEKRSQEICCISVWARTKLDRDRI